MLSHEDTLDLAIDICVLPDVDIPAVTKELQAGLSAYIQQHTGIAVNETKIMVTGLKENSAKLS